MNEQQDLRQLKTLIREWSNEMGFSQMGVTDLDLGDAPEKLQRWLDNGYHGSMQWMENHADLRKSPASLVPGALRSISFRLNYLPPNAEPVKALKTEENAYIARYAMGRDYHKLIRKRLATLAKRIEQWCLDNAVMDEFNQRAFVDSAPVMERQLAEKAGLGSIGKHTLLIHREEGSWFFLGEILTNIPLAVDEPAKEDLCGSCDACLKVCPTDAFPKPYVLDARRCISYWTIESSAPIPEEFREPMGNRVFGCDDCQAICPWNKHAHHTYEGDFHPRHDLDASTLLSLFQWDEAEFLKKTEGSAIRRIGYSGWLRNLAIGLGNAPTSPEIIATLESRLDGADSVVAEHIQWAINRQRGAPKRRKRKAKDPNKLIPTRQA